MSAAELPHVTDTWLRYDDVICERCDQWCGEEESRVFVVEGVGMVCTSCITEDEENRAVVS